MLLKNQPLGDLNTFGLRVHAREFSRVSELDQLRRLRDDGHLESDSLLILGGGSNVLFTGDYDGLVLKNDLKGMEILAEDAESILLRVRAGEVWHQLVLHCVERGWGGIENLSLIPGQVGAAPMQNIGAYGVELRDVFHSLRAFELDSGEVREFSHSDCEFGYRESVFKKSLKGKFIILSIDIRLQKNPVLNTSYGAISQTLEDMGIQDPDIADLSRAVIHIRSSKLPDPAELGNAGSFFKNPVIPDNEFEQIKSAHPEVPSYPAGEGFTKVPAGWLIEQAGWKGKRMGEVGMHARQALVLVNYGHASGNELWEHARRVQASVLEQFGIELSPEVNVY